MMITTVDEEEDDDEDDEEEDEEGDQHGLFSLTLLTRQPLPRR